MRSMKRVLVLVTLLIACSSVAAARGHVQGIAVYSQVVTTAGSNSTNKFTRVLANATVTVYCPVGTTTICTIYSDAAGTAKGNSFTAGVDGSYSFYTDAQSVSIRFSNVSGVPIFTTPDIPVTAGDSVTTLACGGTNDTTLLSTANAAGGTIVIPNGITCASNTQTISAALVIQKGGLLKPITGQLITLAGPQNPDTWQKFTNATTGLGTILFTGNTSLKGVYPEWWGAVGDGVANASSEFTAMIASLPSAGGAVFLTAGSIFRINTAVTISRSNVIWSGYGATLRYQGTNLDRMMNLTGDNNTFQGITFSANNTQPLGALVYVDDNVNTPKFIDCTFRDMYVSTHDILGSTVLSNQVYAVSVSPYGVTNFLFRDCLFYNLRSLNTANVSGYGFVGGITFAKINFGSPDTYNPGTDPQTVVTSGKIEGCTFDTIKTILNSGLSEDNVSIYDDGDAIRGGYGGDVYSGTGVKEVDVSVSDCRFINVSKRAIKFSQIQGLHVSNIQVIADKGAYSMTEVIKMYGNSTINGLHIQSPGIIATLTRSGATVTVTTSTAHGLTTGERVSVFGATEQEYNELVSSVTVTGATTFTYTITGTPTSPATGTIRVAKTPRTGISMQTLQNVSVSNMVMDAGGSFVSFLDTNNPSPPQRNVMITNFAGDNLDLGGIITGTNSAVTAYAITFSNGHLYCIGSTAKAIELPATLGNLGAMRIYNVDVRNGDVKIQGQNNIVDGLTVTINRSDFAGSSTSRSLFEAGFNGTSSYNVFRNVNITVESILSTYLQAPRPALVTIAGSNTTTQNFSLRVPDTLATALPHLDTYGNDCTFDGLAYFGPGFVQMGVTAASNGSVYRNLSRIGTGTGATPFLITTSGATNYVVQNVSDHRAFAGNTFTLAGTPYVLDGLATLTSQYELGGNDSAGTGKSLYRISDDLRREITTTVSANNAAFAVMAHTVNLATSGGAHTGNTLVAPSTSDLDLVIFAAGPDTVGVIAGSTVIFIGAAPTFGTGSGNVGTMTFRSNSAGKWRETGRVLVP